MKESFLIDIHASIDGVMNPRDGTQKDACWNTLLSILKNVNLANPVHVHLSWTVMNF